MKKYIKAGVDYSHHRESDKLKQYIRAIRQDIGAMAASASIEDLENIEWHSTRNQSRYIIDSLPKYDSFDDCIDAWIDSFYSLLQKEKEWLAAALRREAAIPQVQDEVFGMIDTTSYELVDYSPDKMSFDFQIPEGAKAEDTYRFVDAVADATHAKYDGTGRGGSWTTWNLRTPEGVKLDVGYHHLTPGLWSVVIKDY